MKVHPTITEERVMSAVARETTSLDRPGFCITCGVEAEDCEPDTRRRRCEHCGTLGVYGAEELLIRLVS